MSSVLMTKGCDKITVDSAAVAGHVAAGWKIAKITYGDYELKIPQGADLDLNRAALKVNGAANVLMQHYQIAPALGTATYVHAAVALTASAQTVTTLITSPNVPRLVSVKGNTTGMTGNVAISGTNILDELITDTIALSGVSEVAGVKAFKTVTSISMPVKTHSSGDTVSVGVKNIFGIPHIVAYTTCLLLNLFGGSADTDGSLAVNTSDVSKNLYTIAGTPDASTLLDLYYLAGGM
jgi:hypothetical protein